MEIDEFQIYSINVSSEIAVGIEKVKSLKMMKMPTNCGIYRVKCWKSVKLGSK